MDSEAVLFRELIAKGIPARVEARKTAFRSQLSSKEAEAEKEYNLARAQLDKDLESKKRLAHEEFTEGVKSTDSLVSGVYALTLLEKLERDSGALTFRSALDGTNLAMAKNFIEGYRQKKTSARAKFVDNARSIFGEEGVVDKLISLAGQSGGLDQKELNAFYAKVIHRGSNALRMVLPVREKADGLAKHLLESIKAPIEEEELHYHGHFSGPITEVLHIKSSPGTTPTGFVYWDIIPDFKSTEFDHKIESRLIPSLSKLVIDGALPKMVGVGLSYVSLAVPSNALEFLATRTRDEIDIPAHRVNGFEMIEPIQQAPIQIESPVRTRKGREYLYKSNPTDSDAVKKEASEILAGVSGNDVKTKDFMKIFSLRSAPARYTMERYGSRKDAVGPGNQLYLPKETVSSVLDQSKWNGKRWVFPKRLNQSQ